MGYDHLGLQYSQHGLSECVYPVQPFGKRSQRASWLSTRNVRLLLSLPCFCSARASSACRACICRGTCPVTSMPECNACQEL